MRTSKAGFMPAFFYV